MVLVGGDAGVGKTRLIAELGDQIPAVDGRLLVGATPSRGTVAQPFASLVGALRGLLRTLDDGDTATIFGPARTDLARLLPELGPPGTAPAVFDQLSSEPGRLFELVLGILNRLAARHPVALALEDLHWADPSTLDLVDFLARNLDGTRVLLIATYRTDELHRRHPLRPALAELRRLPLVRFVDVAPLDRAEIAELAEALGSAVGPTALDRLAERSSGLPFFIEELVAGDGFHEGADVPASLHEVLQLRVDALGPEVADVVRILGAATTTGPVSDRLLADVTGLSPATLAPMVREAVSHQVLVVLDDGIDFRHALAREVVEDELLPSERAALHARFAAALEHEPRATVDPAISARIAEHWAEANEPASAATWSFRAGTAARHAYAYAEAAEHHQRVLAWWDHLDQPADTIGASRLAVAAGAATALVLGGRLDRARTLIESELAHDDAAPDTHSTPDDRSDDRAALIALQGRIMRSTGGATASIEFLRRSLATFSARPGVNRTRVRVELAHSLALTDRRDEALIEAQAALDEARATGDTATIGRATHVMGHELAMTGDVATGVDLLRSATQMAIETDDVDWVSRGYINLSDVYRLVGRHDEAIATALAGYEVALERGVRRFAFARMNAAESMIPLGRLGEAGQIVADTPDIEGHMAGIHTALTGAWWRLRSGDVDGVEDALAALGPVVAAEDNLQFEGALTRNRLELAWLIGDRRDPWPVAAVVLDRPVATDAGQARPEILALVARLEADRALDATSDPDGQAQASAGLARALEASDALADQILATMRPELAIALIAAEHERGHRHHHPAASRWADAAAAARAASDPWHEAYSTWRQAEALAQQGARDDAASAASSGRALAERIGAAALVARIDELRGWARLPDPAAGTTAGPTPITPVDDHDRGPDNDGDGDALQLARYMDAFGVTPREAEVLALVAEGRTNGEIGAALFISTKTASVHVSAILAKLGVRTRTQAAAAAHQLGDR